MKWDVPEKRERLFDENNAIEGDMYLFHEGKLVFVCNAAVDNSKKSNLFTRLKTFILRFRTP